MTEDLVCLPGEGPLSVTADQDTLIFTLPTGDDGDNIERCDRVAKGLMATCGEFDSFTERFGFYFSTPESDFLAPKIRSQHWGRIELVYPVQKTSHRISIPGPFDISVRQVLGTLSLLVAKVKR